MSCEYCHRGIIHHSRCPLYKEQKTAYYCSICGEGIQNEEEYIVNDDNEYAHFECVDTGREMAKFLGYDIKKMDEEYD